MIEGDIGFNLSVYQGGGTPRVGDTVTAECVECKHNRMGWRATKSGYVWLPSFFTSACLCLSVSVSISPSFCLSVSASLSLCIFLSLSLSSSGSMQSFSSQQQVKQEGKFGIVVSGQGEFGDVELSKKRSTVFTIR